MRIRPALFFLAVALLTARSLEAQAVSASGESTASASATTNDSGPAGIVPYRKGYNLSLGTTSQHDSANGWSSILTPNFAYRLNRHLSFDAGIPVYAYINVAANRGTRLRPNFVEETKRFVVGDAALNGHFETNLSLFDYEATATLGLPSGNTAFGLGAGQVSYSFNNHFERSAGIFSPDLEVGIGDSSSLVSARARKSFVLSGELAHFQAGTSVDLPRNLTFSANAYEELPVSSTTTFSTTRRGRRRTTTATTQSAPEDNGFLTALDIPLNPHLTLSGFYNRSLRAHIDTAGFTFTFLLKPPPRREVE